ncbi:ATP-dependent Clp protease ATP-binding subunit, partial [Lacticaseibacillus paracasei]
MLCENCHKNPATIHLSTVVNGTRQEINLCQNCYQLLKNQAGGNMRPTDATDPFGFGSLDDIFRAMNQGMDQPQQPNAQTPPTQAGRGGNGNNGRNGNRGKGLLGQFGVDLTEQARNGQIDPVIGRDKEISRVIEILNRRTKNNPVLIGEA